MATDAVRLSTKGNIAVVRLNRPKVHNAVNDAVMSGLEESLTDIDSNRRIRFVIVTGAGRKSFCSGGDLRYFATLQTRRQGTEMTRRMQRILSRLSHNGRVVIAAINGQVLGGGCEITLAAHLRINSSRAVFSSRQVANGLTTAWGGGVRLLKLLGPPKALRLLLTAEDLNAREALRYGLVDQIAPSQDVVKAAFELCERISANSEEAVWGILSLRDALDRETGQDLLKLETELLSNAWDSTDFQRVLGLHAGNPNRRQTDRS